MPARSEVGRVDPVAHCDEPGSRDVGHLRAEGLRLVLRDEQARIEARGDRAFGAGKQSCLAAIDRAHRPAKRGCAYCRHLSESMSQKSTTRRQTVQDSHVLRHGRREDEDALDGPLGAAIVHPALHASAVVVRNAERLVNAAARALRCAPQAATDRRSRSPRRRPRARRRPLQSSCRVYERAEMHAMTGCARCRSKLIRTDLVALVGGIRHAVRQKRSSVIRGGGRAADPRGG